jgi:hypothetical protein
MNTIEIQRKINDLNNLNIYLNKNGFKIDSIINNGTVILAYTYTLYTSDQIIQINQLANAFDDDHSLGDNGIKRISKFNSYQIPLSPLANYEGIYEDMSDFSTLTISCISDVKGILEIYYSNNGNEIHYKDTITIMSNICFFDIKTITFRYYKIKFINDYKIQTLFSLLTNLHLYKKNFINDSSIKKSVEIQEETIVTGGNYRTESKKITIQPRTTSSYTYIWPYRTSVLEMRFIAEEIHRHDTLNFYVARDTVIGVLIENTSINTNSIRVSPTVIQNIKLGYLVSLLNTQGNVLVLGDVMGINADTLTVSNNIVTIFVVGDLVRISLQPVRNFVISAPWEYAIGRSKIGSSSIPPNTNLSIEYTNNSDVVKDFVWYFDYLF